MQKVFLSFVILCMCASVVAQETARKSPVAVAPLPVITYGSSTSLLLGAMLVFSFSDPDNPDAENDMISVNANYTLKNQKLLLFDYTKYLGDDSLVYQGSFGYKDFPSSFNGLGSHNSSGEYEEFGQLISFFEQALLFKIETGSADTIRVGPSYKFARVIYGDLEKGKALDRGEVPGIDDTIVSSPGVKFVYDSRDNGIYPSNGFYFDAEMHLNNRIFGATQDSAGLDLDYGHFFDLGDSGFLKIKKNAFIIGIQGLVASQGGDVPFHLMNVVGDDSIVRGYGSRYQDKCRAAAQIEFRYPLWWRFSGTVFAGTGNVAEDPFSYDMRDSRYAAGIGLRYAVIEEEKINLRFDIAYNREGEFCPIMSIMEAF